MSRARAGRVEVRVTVAARTRRTILAGHAALWTIVGTIAALALHGTARVGALALAVEAVAFTAAVLLIADRPAATRGGTGRARTTRASDSPLARSRSTEKGSTP